ncbi:MAG TPA: TetR/AcrR family transcriptional regulator [Methylibium sp.]|uniref:TetR/AcrR family transcriptional regulator n=1 Tax=Methylibium sp. TaxID=2067992 RepID=UPI002DB71869|nr:TetR/AcrR family transcriptional regulator [Methylibium sp.]HEU4457819.1 TetR/AcrR family transcriptional regulator [Methylibium sp.]
MSSAPDRPPERSARKRGAPASVEAARASLTRERWIEAATEVLVDQGIDHVRVDVLARQMAVTRGSFYWHFKDREELLAGVLRSWHENATEQLTLRLDRPQVDAREQLRDVLSLPFRGRAAARAARIELAIRAWARRDLQVRHAVDASDAARIGYIAQLFSALGFAVGDARARAFMLYSYVVGESLMATQGSAAQRRDRCVAVERLLIGDAPR